MNEELRDLNDLTPSDPVPPDEAGGVKVLEDWIEFDFWLVRENLNSNAIRPVLKTPLAIGERPQPRIGQSVRHTQLR